MLLFRQLGALILRHKEERAFRAWLKQNKIHMLKGVKVVKIFKLPPWAK